MLTTRRRSAAHALAALASALLLVALVALVAADTAAAQGAKRIGQTQRVPAPACPGSPCEAIGSVTGFQQVAQGRRGLMRAREDGHLVAWQIRQSRPNQNQRQFFGNFYEHTRFGVRPHARIAVLRRIDARRFRLMRQSPVVDITPALGSRQTYTLSQPLRIRKGQFLALTIPTWAPAFAVNLPPQRNVWRASRPRGKCVRTQDIRASRTHQNVGSDRVYGCTYNTARLLYWGLYTPD